jgi:tyrosinase
VRLLSAGQLALLRDGFRALQGLDDDRGYRVLAGIHGLPLPIGCDNAHGTAYFLPWHRAYLYLFERAMRDQVEDSELAWWDWTTGRIPRAFTARTGGGEPNPLFDAAIDPLGLQQFEQATGEAAAPRTVREVGAVPLPTRAEVVDVLSRSDFLDFSFALEDLHNRVHVHIGGSMSQITFASYEPIFWAHHTMVDRLWRIWQLRHADVLPPADILDDALAPFPMTVRQTLDTTALGYDYAVATRSQPVRMV